jgi:hypothetical protein
LGRGLDRAGAEVLPEPGGKEAELLEVDPFDRPRLDTGVAVPLILRFAAEDVVDLEKRPLCA